MIKSIVLGVTLAILTMSFSGCENNNSIETTSYLPKEINTNKLTLLTEPKVDENESLQRYGHHTLQNHLESVEVTQKLLEINLLLSEKLMNDIKSHCEETGVGELCDMESETFSLVFDDDLINQMTNIAGETLDEEELAKKGQKIPFGRMTYIEYDETERYQYNLVMDTTVQEKFLGGDGVDSGAEIKWSTDKRQVFSFYSFNDGNLTNTLSLDFNKTENDAQVDIENNVSDSEGNTYNYCYLKLDDMNKSLNIIGTMNTNDAAYELSSQLYVAGELSQYEPYLNYFGQINQIGFEEHTIFDNNESIISSKFCNANLECNLSDESTWFTPKDKKSNELLYDMPTPAFGVVEIPDYTDTEDFKKTIAEGVTVVAFFAPWNGPSRFAYQALDPLDNEFDDRVTFIYLNTDVQQRLAIDYGIRSIPMVLIFKDSLEKERLFGAMPTGNYRDVINNVLEE